MRSIASSLALVALALPGVANACGGFFCNRDEPVDQSAEEILFAVDEGAGTTSMHIKILYEGPASEFSWVVPVPEIPELGIGTEALFSSLRGAGSRWYLDYAEEGTCEWTWGVDYSSSFASSPAGGTGTGTGSTGGGGVTIVETGVVGPYETVILQATDSAALVQWLTDNHYDVPPGFDPILAPYVAANSAFVGLKLQKDKDVGDLAPLVLNYPGTKPSIPIQLTSVSATPDMRLRVYVLGEARAVPESYLHVQLNHLAVDWWRGGDNFEDVVSLAADEAGGHAFATDYSGSPTALIGQLSSPDWTVGRLEQAADAFEFLTTLIDYGYPATTELRLVLNDHIPVPPGLGISDTELYNCPWCYESELRAAPFDALAAAADTDEMVLAPLREVDRLMQTHSWLTRLTSSVSPVEMTVDPTFVFNPDMPEQPQVRRALESTNCLFEHDPWRAPRTLTLQDRRRVSLPSRESLAAAGITEFEYLNPLTVPAAAIIERTGASGPPEVLVDNTPQLQEDLAAFEEGGPHGSRGCGCETTGSGNPAWTLALGLIVLILGRRE